MGTTCKVDDEGVTSVLVLVNNTNHGESMKFAVM